MPDAAALLRLDEAVELGTAAAARIGGEHGIRVLVIKGATLSRQGLRTARTSADIDVLVDPARFDDYCELMGRSGWQTRDGIFITDQRAMHSLTFLREGWPCDLDVHSFYPGFLRSPQEVFDALWARRATMPFAHVDVCTPDRISSILILALHSLRGSALQARHADELEDLVRRAALDDDEKHDLGTLALATGCAATLETVLPRLGVEVRAPQAEIDSIELKEWRERVASGSHGAYFWLLTFRHSSGRGRLAIAWNAFWPSDHDLLVARPEIRDRFWSKLRGRALRWGRGLRSLPRAARAIWSNRR